MYESTLTLPLEERQEIWKFKETKNTEEIIATVIGEMPTRLEAEFDWDLWKLNFLLYASCG